MTTVTRDEQAAPERAHDPLRLCVYTTIALLAWALGPAVVVVLAYLTLAAVAGGTGVALQVSRWF